MSVKTGRYRTNGAHEVPSPTPDEVISSRTEPTKSRRRRVLKTGDLIHFDLDSPPEDGKKITSRTKSVDDDTPQKKRVKTPFRSVKKVKTVATDSSRKRRKSELIHELPTGKNTNSKKGEESVSPSFKAVNFDIESPSAEENLQKSTKSSFRSARKSAHVTTHSDVASSSKKNNSVTYASKLTRRSMNNNNTENIRFRLSGVELFKSSYADSVETENKNVLINAGSSQAESLLVEGTQKRKSIQSPIRSNKKFKISTIPKFTVDSPTKDQNSPLVHQPLIVKEASPLVEGNAEKIKEDRILKSPHLNDVNSQMEEKNVQKPSQRKSLPVQNSQPKRKIVRAKRLLNHTANQLRDNESAIHTVSEVQTSLKKKRRTWQRQDNFDLDSFCESFNYNAQNEDKQKTAEVIESCGGKDEKLDNYHTEGEDKQNETEVAEENIDIEQDTIAISNEEISRKGKTEDKHTKEIEIIEIIDLVEESSNCMADAAGERKQNVNGTFELVVTTCEDPISPSTTNPDPQSPGKSLSPIANLLHFDSSEEEIQPSTSGLAPETTSKRRTYELQNSVTDVSILKTMSEQDSVKIKSFSSEEKDLSKDLPFSHAAVTRSKVTMRRRFDKNDDDFFNGRISRITSPWMTEEDVDSEAESSLETSTPMPVTKGRFTLLKEVLTKEKPTFHDFNRGKNFKGLGLAKMSISLTHDRNTGNQNSANIKKQAPHVSFKHSSTKKVPNFAAIHKRALDKVENIHEYKKRKEERAQMLLSGKKPPVSQTPKQKTKKQLRFDPGTSDNLKPLNFIPLPSTPLPRRTRNESLDSTITPEKVAVPKFKFVASKENLFSMGRGVLTPKWKQNSSNSKSNNVELKVLTPKNNNRKEVFRFGNNNSRFGWNIAKPAVVMKKEEIKAMVATKSKAVKNVVESRRVMIKGVRSNRRFELLMNMRKGK